MWVQWHLDSVYSHWTPRCDALPRSTDATLLSMRLRRPGPYQQVRESPTVPLVIRALPEGL